MITRRKLIAAIASVPVIGPILTAQGANSARPDFLNPGNDNKEQELLRISVSDGRRNIFFGDRHGHYLGLGRKSEVPIKSYEIWGSNTINVTLEDDSVLVIHGPIIFITERTKEWFLEGYPPAIEFKIGNWEWKRGHHFYVYADFSRFVSEAFSYTTNGSYITRKTADG